MPLRALRPVRSASTAEPLPPCPECTTALHPVGGARHRYWSCRHCGTTLRRF